MIQRHIFIWVVSFALVIASNLFYTSNYLQDAVSEKKSVVLFLGNDVGRQVLSNSNVAYKACCNFLASFTQKIFVPNKGSTVDDDVKSSARMIHGAFWTSIYMSIVRAQVSLLWLYSLCFLFVGIFFHGYVRREHIKYSLSWSSPDKYGWGWHSMIASVGLFFSYIFFPIAITPFAPAVMLVLSMFGFYLLVSNFQQKI